MPLLELKCLTKKFGGLIAINQLNLVVETGEILGLIGPNGAGKTTTFSVITGDLSPSDGRILFEGTDIAGLKTHQIAAMGVVRTFQLMGIFPGLSTLQNILIGLHLNSNIGLVEAMINSKSNYRKEVALTDQAVEILEFMGLEPFQAELAANLPHGHQRKLSIAIGIASNPKLLLLDEPMTGMNQNEVIELVETIRMIRDKLGITLVVVEHNIQGVMALCERLVVINFGSKIAEGSPQEIMEHKGVIEAYLGDD